MDKESIIKVIDARMGRGKTSAAINYMEQHKNDKRFMYVTPFLKEVDRICEACDFDQPDSDTTTKLSEMKVLIDKGSNIAATHALFYLMNQETLDLIRDKKYSIIIDEAISPISKVHISQSDTDILLNNLVTEDENHMLHWADPNYTGRFDIYKQMADSGSLIKLDWAIVSIMNPELLMVFDEVFMMTYLFEGQYQKAYLDYFGFKYEVVGIEGTPGGFKFSEKPDSPPPVDYNGLISLIPTEDKINDIGRAKHALSIAWYTRRGADNAEMKQLRNNLRTFFNSRANVETRAQLWTCPKEHMQKVCGDRGRFASGFLQMSARATNEYKDRVAVAYLVNRFADPSITKFFAEKDIYIDEDKFALGEMLQFIWRSAIRDNNHISLYIPSKRMRTLFINWLNAVSKGGELA